MMYYKYVIHRIISPQRIHNPGRKNARNRAVLTPVIHRLWSAVHTGKTSSCRALSACRVRAVLDAIDQRMESAGGTRLRILLHEWGYSSVQPQYAIRTSGGSFRADFALPELKLVIEFDGKGKYGDNTSAQEVLLAERRRESLLIEEGWSFLRVRWEDFDDDASLRGRIRLAVTRARLAAHPATPRSPFVAEIAPHAG